MVDAWPGTLPKPRFDGYGDTFYDGRIMSRTDIGPPKVRRRTSNAIRPIRFNMTMTDAQLTTLKTFIYTTILNGALPFTMTDPAFGGTATFMIGENMPTFTPISNTRWEVTLDFWWMA